MSMEWQVHGTKNGGLPVKVEKRGQKVVTIVQNVTKNPELLLFALKRSLGTGGNVSAPGIIEIQGNKKDLVEAHLLDCPHQLKAVAGLKEAKAAAKGASARKDKTVVDAPRPGDADNRREKPRWDRRDKESERRFVASGCGCSWIYCCGNSCKDVVIASGVKPQDDIFGETDDPWAAARPQDGAGSAVHVVVDIIALNQALRVLGMLSEATPRSPPSRRKVKVPEEKISRAAAASHLYSSSGRSSSHARPTADSDGWRTAGSSAPRSAPVPHRAAAPYRAPAVASSSSVRRQQMSDPRRQPDRPHTSKWKASNVGPPKKQPIKPANGGYLGSQRKGQQRGNLQWDDGEWDEADWGEDGADDYYVESTPSYRPPRATATALVPTPDLSHPAAAQRSQPHVAPSRPVEVAPTVPVEAVSQAHLEAKYESMIHEVLGNSDFDWDTMLNSMSFGISENDSFLAALESSLADAADEALFFPASSDHSWDAAHSVESAFEEPDPRWMEDEHDAPSGAPRAPDPAPAPAGSGFWDYDGEAGEAPPSKLPPLHVDRYGVAAPTSRPLESGSGGDPADVLVAMGFDLKTARVCLADCGGDVQRAADVLLGQASALSPPPPTHHTKAPSMSESGYQLGPRRKAPKVSDDDLAILQAMGFPRAAASDALQAAEGNIERAIERLTG